MARKGTVRDGCCTIRRDNPLRTEGTIERPSLRLVEPVLQALVDLSDEALHTVLCRAEELLLDHSVLPHTQDQFMVDIVTRDEWYLLAAYRALAPRSQQRVLGELAQLSAAAPGHRARRLLPH